MAVEYPYAVATGKIPVLFDKIARVGKPSKVDTSWLKAVGLTSSNDVRLITILRHIGFVDGSKAPTDLWQQYRGPSGKTALAGAIRSAYSELFHTYSDANQATVEDLSNFVRSNTDLGPEAVSKAVTTFRSLVDIADFSGKPASSNDDQENRGDTGRDDQDNQNNREKPARNAASGVVINVNLQLSLPATTDPKFFDEFFAALNKHILAGTNTDD